MRRLFVASCALVAIIGMPLFLWPTETERNFAWTIRPPVTAAFMGAAYWASFVVVFLALREPTWARARIGLWFAFAFAWLTMVATFLHLDRFHLGAPFAPAARIMTWTWLAVYVGVPLAQLALVIGLGRTRGENAAIERRIPGWYRAVTGAIGLVSIAIGLALFVAPAPVAATLWPWPLTPLTGRTVGAWLVAWGVVAGQIAIEADWRRVRPGLAGLAAFAVLELVVLARFRDGLEWAGGRPAAFAVGAATLLVVALAGFLLDRSAR